LSPPVTTTAGTEADAGYPSRWEADVVLSDGGTVHIRPIRPSDADTVNAFHRRLSAETIYLRFFSPLPNLSPAMLARFVNVDYVDRMALVAELGDELFGVARYDRLPSPPGQEGGAEAEVAFTIGDAHQGRGIGTILLEHLAGAAKHAGISRFVAETLPQNQRMLRVFHDAGFGDELVYGDGVVRVEFPIDPTEASVKNMHEREDRAAARSIRRLLAPRTVAVVGASGRPDSIGHRTLRNLLAGGFAGPVYPVHPTAHHVCSVRAYPSVLDVPDVVDLAVILVPASEVPGVVEECGRKRVAGLVVVSSGFAERDAEGAALEHQVVSAARRNGMRLIGPNCMGVVNTDPQVNLNTTFSPVVPARGRIGFMSQSGGLGVVILDEMVRRGLGASTFVSIGNKADVSGNDLLQYWEDDANTDLVLMYLESFGNPRTFARVARRFSRRKPIVAVKSGRSPSGTRAALLHTAALAATDASVDALFRQTGVIRVDTLEELFDVAQVLASQPLPAGRKVAIVGNGGGPGVLCADASEAAGLTVPELSEATQTALRGWVKPGAVVSNPVDLDPQATPADFERALAAVLADDEIDAAIAIFVTPLAPPLEKITAAILSGAATSAHKPVLASVLGRRLVMAADDTDGAPSSPALPPVPSFAFPEAAARALAQVVKYAEWRHRPLGTVPEFPDVDVGAARLLVATALAEHLTSAVEPAVRDQGVWLDLASAMQLLHAYRVPVAQTEHVHSADEAIAAAEAIGYPVALKAAAPELVHRRDIGGVRLGLTGADAVRAAFDDVEAAMGNQLVAVVVQAMAPEGIETVVEVVTDELFGPLVAFGTGGIIGEVVQDRSFRALPLSDLDAHDLVTAVRGAPLLLGRLGMAAADLGALEQLLLRVARLVEDVPELAELSLDPVIASPGGATAAGVRVRLAPSEPHPERALRRLR
jgi:acetyl coenzyme A synthetase (ADP forming)-like protein